jgi:hypothetical protein
VGVVLLVALAFAVVVAVAMPLLREPTAGDRIAPIDDAARARLQLREDRDEALAALGDLEFDRRTGKIGDQDHAELATPLRARVAAALAALESEPAPPGEPTAVDQPTSDAAITRE